MVFRPCLRVAGRLVIFFSHTHRDSERTAAFVAQKMLTLAEAESTAVVRAHELPRHDGDENSTAGDWTKVNLG
jgi:hypothetical protein